MTHLAVTEVYDPARRRWHEVAPLPTPRSGIAAEVLEGVIFVVGGEGSRRTFRENEAYWPETDTWR